MNDTQVLIAGAGPVGMTMALLMAKHGIKTTIVEQSNDTTEYPKMDLTNGRSMEIYRFIGIADELRSLGTPEDHSLDILWATGPAGHLLHREHYPSPAEQRKMAREENDGTNTTEPRLRISQVIVEKYLKEKIQANPMINSIFGWAVSEVEQDEDGVNTTIIHSANGAKDTISSDYIVGCDGGNSTVRRCLGTNYDGTWDVIRICTHHFTSDETSILRSLGNYYHLQWGLNTLISQDGQSTWTIHGNMPDDFVEGESDIHALLEERIGQKIDYDLNLHSFWAPHLVIAEDYRTDRAFLVGDAAHQFIPTGGYGMNTGVAEAFDLSWKLAAVLKGWGGDTLLDSYHIERRPIAVQNRSAAEHNMNVRLQVLGYYIEAFMKGDLDAPEAEPTRQQLAKDIASTYDGEYEAWGVEFGYRYGDSPVIEYGSEDSDPPVWDRRKYIPSTYPGVRIPALFEEDGTAIHDLIGTELTLLVSGKADLAPLTGAADKLSIPLKVRELPEEQALSKFFTKAMTIVRPDHHVAWRGDHCPSDPEALLSKIVGMN